MRLENLGWAVITAVVGLVMWAARVSPEQAESNLSAWLRKIGVNHPPEWLRGRLADRRVRRGCYFLLLALMFVGGYLFRYPAPTSSMTSEHSSPSNERIQRDLQTASTQVKTLTDQLEALGKYSKTPTASVEPIKFDPLSLGIQGGSEPMFLDIEIRGVVSGSRPIQLQDAYIVSQMTGDKMQMMIESGKEGPLLPKQANPIPPELPFWLDAKFDKPMNALQVLSEWGKVLFIAEYAGKMHETEFGEDYMRKMLAGYRGSPLSPHITSQPNPDRVSH